jgi:hypothetical protein
VWPGRKLPGHMGYEWRLQPGLLVLRINPIEQAVMASINNINYFHLILPLFK